VTNPPSTASFTASPTSGTAPLSVQFTDTSTGSPGSWTWNFGDGTTSTVQNPTHSYALAGTYTATLTASNAGGASSPASRTITVTNPPPTIKRASVSTLVTSTAVGRRTIAKPSGTAAGDVLVSCLTLTSGSVTAAPAGWARFAAVIGATRPKVYGYYKVATGSEPASYSWTTSSVTGSAGIARYSGARGLDGAATTAWSNATVTTATVPGVTTTTTNVMLVGCMGTNSASTGITAPSGLAQAWELGVRASELDDGLQPAPGATGAKTWTFGTGRAWAGWVVGLRP
jgi:PKD repeat protein